MAPRDTYQCSRTTEHKATADEHFRKRVSYGTSSGYMTPSLTPRHAKRFDPARRNPLEWTMVIRSGKYRVLDKPDRADQDHGAEPAAAGLQ